jgi:hypothetical protein
LPTWDVVVTVKAPLAYVLQFVAVYRQLGATRIHIYYDDPAHSYSVGGPDVVETVCDATYWNGRRPRAVEKRQMANATVAARASASDWIIHCDIDEHLYAPGAIAEELASLPISCGCLTALTVEAVYARVPGSLPDLFQTPYFKSSRPGWKACLAFWTGVYGDLVQISLAGFWGHRVGKSFIRTSRLPDLHSMPIHMPSGPTLAGLMPIKSKSVVVRHYDALLPDDWLRKHLDRTSGVVRAAWAGQLRNMQSQMIADAMQQGGPVSALALYERMFVLSEAQLATGVARGTIRVIPPVPSG